MMIKTSHASGVPRSESVSPTTPMTVRVALLLAFVLTSCISDPVSVQEGLIVPGDRGVIVVNEGVWGQDNASLTYIDPKTHLAGAGDYYASANPGLHLGDVANGITTFDGLGFIPVTGSRSVEVIDLATGRERGRMTLSAPHQPRSVAILDSTLGCVTSLADSIVVFDPRTLVAVRTVGVGPAPEGVAAVGADRVLVANSGLGLFRPDEPGAGTLSLVDVRNGNELERIPVGPDPRQIVVNESHVYVSYGFPDSLGGIVEFDKTTLRESRRWLVQGVGDMTLSSSRHEIYAIGSRGIMKIVLTGGLVEPRLFLELDRYPNSIFYSLHFDDATGELFAGLTQGYQPIPGRVVIVGPDGTERARVECGIYPGAFASY